MRSTALLVTLLLVFGLVPVVGWLVLAANLDPSGLGRGIGKALLVLFSPMPVGGLLMFGAAALFQRGYLAPRIVATVGTVFVFLGAATIAVAAILHFGSCGPSGACTSELFRAVGFVVYAALQIGLIVLVWRAPR